MMVIANSILIADDENAFLESTAELLRRDGYQCDCAADADKAVEMLKTNRYDLIISDIKMPGNTDLRLVRETQNHAAGVPVILVTAYPSAETAIDAIELPVVAYLKKPVDLDELLRHVYEALKRTDNYQTIAKVRHALQEVISDLDNIASGRQTTEGAKRDASLSGVMLRNLATCLAELKRLAEQTPGHDPMKFCELLGCTEWLAYRDVIQEAIHVLQETKRRFKSKELATLRARLETVLEASTPS